MVSGDTVNAETQIRDGIDPRHVFLEASSYDRVQSIPAGFVTDANVRDNAVWRLADDATVRVVTRY